MKTEYSYNPALGISIIYIYLNWHQSGMNIPDMFCHEMAHLIEHNKSLYLSVPIVALTSHSFLNLQKESLVSKMKDLTWSPELQTTFLVF